MVLGCDIGSVLLKILDRLVAAPVSILQFCGFSATGKSYELMSQADAEDRLLTQKLPYNLDLEGTVLRISRTVGKYDAIGVYGRICSAVAVAEDCYIAISFGQRIDDAGPYTIINQCTFIPDPRILMISFVVTSSTGFTMSYSS